jgi:E3 ubiquitin-protein ligase TRIP12
MKSTPYNNWTNRRRMKYLFHGLGKFVARSMLDSRIIDIHFNPLFFRLAENDDDERPSILSLMIVDARLYESLKLLQRISDTRRQLEEEAKRLGAILPINTSIEDLALDFTLPGYSNIELKVMVHPDLNLYIAWRKEHGCDVRECG